VRNIVNTLMAVLCSLAGVTALVGGESAHAVLLFGLSFVLLNGRDG